MRFYMFFLINQFQWIWFDSLMVPAVVPVTNEALLYVDCIFPFMFSAPALYALTYW